MVRLIKIAVILLALLTAGCVSTAEKDWPWYYEDSPYHRQTGAIER